MLCSTLRKTPARSKMHCHLVMAALLFVFHLPLAVGAAPTCTSGDKVLGLMCADLNFARLLEVEAIDDRHNAQFLYTRQQLQAIAAQFPADDVSWGSATSDQEQETLRQSVRRVVTVLLEMAASIQQLEPWQEHRVALLKSIQQRFEGTPRIPKWYHGFYTRLTDTLGNGTVQPDKKGDRSFSDIWFDHKPGAFYGPYWMAVDWDIEMRNLSCSFYPSVGDRNRSSWYISTTPTPPLPLFTPDGGLNSVGWVVENQEHLHNFTELVRSHLPDAKAQKILGSVVLADEARLQDVVVKLGRVYSFDRANLVAEMVVLPQWAGYTPTPWTPQEFNWCSAKVCLNGVSSRDNTITSLSTLHEGTILRTWGYGDEIVSNMPKFLLVVKEASEGRLPVVADVLFDRYPGSNTAPTRRVLVRQLVNDSYTRNATHVSINIFSPRCCGFHPLAVSTVQVFGSVRDTLNTSMVPDVNRLVADGLWNDAVPVFPYSEYSGDCGSQFCSGVCDRLGPDTMCLFSP
eukprot:Sspe_Gene.68697::Locus_40506_Transcript_1_1_Confidence_1.000_Length_2281::g.68697::m.68697